MILNKSKKRGNQFDRKPLYLRYDDVFISKDKIRQSADNNNYNRKRYQQECAYQEEENEDNFPEDDFVPEPQKDFVNEKMVKYQKRQMPPLQRYGDNNPKSMYEEYRASSSYWDDDRYHERNREDRRYYRGDGSWHQMWKKFLITFGWMLLLVLVAWSAYSFGNRNSKNETSMNGLAIIEPEGLNIKILPDNPGGLSVPHQDKMIYSHIGGARDATSIGNSSLTDDGQQVLLPPELPQINMKNEQVDEYSFVDERTYYIKVSSNKDKEIVRKEMNNIKNRYIGAQVTCSIRIIRDQHGKQKYAVIIGPFDSKSQAIKSAQELDMNCSVISVKD
jgi:hypothetical protein